MLILNGNSGTEFRIVFVENKEESLSKEAGKGKWYAQELNVVGVTAQGESELCMCV